MVLVYCRIFYALSGLTLSSWKSEWLVLWIILSLDAVMNVMVYIVTASLKLRLWSLRM
jgi:hypothetical protein